MKSLIKLVIVGSTCADPKDTKPIIRAVINRINPDIVGSGEAKGTDTHVKEVCDKLGVYYKGFSPEHRSWLGTPILCGFRCRNLRMVRWGDRGVRIGSRQSPTYGSGWTIDRMEDRGKPVERYMVD